MFFICKCCFGRDHTLPQARLGAGSLKSGHCARQEGIAFFVHLPPQVSQSDAEQYLISLSGLCRLETKYLLFLSLDDICM